MNRPTRPLAATAALGLFASLAVAAVPGPGCYVALANGPGTDDDVIACEQQQWFHKATTLATNVGFVEPSHGLATFDTKPPAGSVTGGNGGGYVATQALGQDPDLVEAEFDGSYTGVIDSLDVDLHILAGTENTLQGDTSIRVELHVDGVPVWSGDLINLKTNPEPASAAGSKRLDFAFTGIAQLLKTYGIANGPDTVHQVKLEVGEHWTDNIVAFAFDTTEVPGGIGFNRVTLAPNTTVTKVG